MFSDGTPVSWWLDRDGERRTYWAGFQPGIQQCSCSLEGNCIDTDFFCNCDADRDSWQDMAISPMNDTESVSDTFDHVSLDVFVLCLNP